MIVGDDYLIGYYVTVLWRVWIRIVVQSIIHKLVLTWRLVIHSTIYTWVLTSLLTSSSLSLFYRQYDYSLARTEFYL